MDRETREALFSARREELLRIAYVVCGDVETAHDTVAVVHGRVLRARGSRELTVARLHRWLVRALLGAIGWRARSAVRNRAAVEAVARRSPAPDVAEAHARWTALLRLPADQRTATALHALAALEPDAVAQACGLSTATASAMIEESLAGMPVEAWHDALVMVSTPVVDAPGFDERSQWRAGRRTVVVRGGAVAAVLVLMATIFLRLNGGQVATGATTEAPAAQPVPHWTTVDHSPLRGRADPLVVAAGDRFVVFGGWLPRAGVTDPVPPADQRDWLDDGALYDPAADRWDPLPRPPTTPSGWQVLSATWTGRDVVVLGRRWLGRDADGAALSEPFAAALDLAQRHWRVLTVPSTALGLGVHTAVWSGREILIWGYNDALADEPLVELGLDPERNAWRDLAPSELSARTGHTAVWTGREMVVVGGAGEGIEAVEATAYDPLTDRWRPLADAPLADRTNPVAVWTGDRLVVWGGQHGWTDRRDGAVYDSVADQWTPMAEGPDAGALATAFWTGRDLVVAGGWRVFGDRTTLAAVNAYDLGTNQWRSLPDLPIGVRCRAGGAFTGGRAFVWGGLRDCTTPVSTTVASNQAAVLDA